MGHQSTAETAVHDLRNRYDEAAYELGRMRISDPGIGWGPSEDDARIARRNLDALAADLAAAEQRLAAANAAYANAARLTRKQFAGLLGIAPDNPVQLRPPPAGAPAGWPRRARPPVVAPVHGLSVRSESTRPRRSYRSHAYGFQ